MRRFVLLACAMSVALVVCLAGVQAHAQDSQPQQGAVPEEGPPEAVLMKGEKELQEGRLGTHC